MRLVAIGGNRRDLWFPRHPAKGATRYWRGDGRDSRLMPANAGISRLAPAAFNSFAPAVRSSERAAIFRQIEHRRAIDNQ